MSRTVQIFDTTLRDGEQVPGAKLGLEEKVLIARQLKKLGVDYIEAGFPASSKGDFEAVSAIAAEMRQDGPVVTALARAVQADIDQVYHSVKGAARPLIHMVLGSSNAHVEKKMRKTKEEILQIGVDAVKYAKTLLPDVQYSTEDASRSDFDYLIRTIEAVVRAGATIVNVPDTVGFAVPEEFGALIYKINDRIKNINPDVLLSVHCHNDLGLSTANTLAAIKNGADKIEGTINGIGERAGNCAIEEVVMGLVKRPDYYGAVTGIRPKEIIRTSKLVSSLMGIDVQVNKAIVGGNAFAHSSGIHQDGLLKSKDVYEIIDPKEVGREDMELVLTARSGKHAVRQAVADMGFVIDDPAVTDEIHKEFLALADTRIEVYDVDMSRMVKGILARRGLSSQAACLYSLEDLQVISNISYPSATVKLRCDDEEFVETASGDGPIDALFKAILRIVNKEVKLMEYKVNSISMGHDARGKASLEISCGDKIYSGRAIDTDIIKASGSAFVNALNKAVLDDSRAVQAKPLAASR